MEFFFKYQVRKADVLIFCSMTKVDHGQFLHLKLSLLSLPLLPDNVGS